MVKKIYLLTLVLFFFWGSNVTAQLSEGGSPRKVSQLKKTGDFRVKMPAVNNEMLRWETQAYNRDSKLKPFVFARNFEVDLSPLKDGQWFRSEDGWWIWQIQIVSEDNNEHKTDTDALHRAFSLGLRKSSCNVRQ